MTVSVTTSAHQGNLQSTVMIIHMYNKEQPSKQVLVNPEGILEKKNVTNAGCAMASAVKRVRVEYDMILRNMLQPVTSYSTAPITEH
jgi:peptide deformylase